MSDPAARFRAANAEIISACAPPCLSGSSPIAPQQEISMNKTTLKATTSPVYAYSADCPELKEQFDQFISELVEPVLSASALANALSGGIDDLAPILRGVPALEGKLLELAIVAVAQCNPDLEVVTQPRLPILAEAEQVIELNDPANYRALTFDSDMVGMKTYKSDFIFFDKVTKVAHVVDAKRSMYTYDHARTEDLKKRMKAVGLVLPHWLCRHSHRRMIAEEVRIAILTADNRKTDLHGGIWHISHIDHLVEVDSAPGRGVTLFFDHGLAAVTGRRLSPGPWV
jgi:hypothetical protein